MKRILFFALLSTLFLGFGLMAQDMSEDNVPYSITLDPIADINPVKTQHTIVATVLDKQGRPLANQRVEWILARAPLAVGDIVEHDDMNSIVGSEQKVVKLGNHYTISYTNQNATVLTMGTPDTRDDVPVGVGQTWLTITSPVEGETHIIAFCPAIKNADNHKTFAIKYWIDAKIQWPEDAVNKVGTPHTFVFKMTKASNNAPLVGYQVKWDLQQAETDPAAYLGNDPAKRVEQGLTNELGESSVVLNQLKPQEGSNVVKIELRKPNGELLATRTVTKRWISPKIMVQKTGPMDGILGEKVVYNIEVSNPGAADANDVVVKDILPDGFSYAECSVPPDDVQGKILTWKLGTLEKDAVKRMALTVKADQVGTWVNTVDVTSREFPVQTAKAETKIGAPEVYIIKEGPAELRKDNLASYTITVKNTGNAVAKDVVIHDEVPAGMKYRDKLDGFRLRWNVGDLNPGQEMKYFYTLEAVNTGVFINNAKVFVKNKEAHKTEFKTTVIAPELKLTKEGSMRVYLGKPSDYTITVSNEGNAIAYDMVAVDTLPKELEYISSEPRGTFKPAKGDELATITWKLGDIAPGKSIVLKLVTRANTVGTSCRNAVKLRSDSQELPKIQPLEAFAETNIMGIPAMHINSYDIDDPIEVGKTTIYVIEIRNEGSSPCTNVILEDHLDDEVEYVSANGPTPHRAEGNKIFFDPYPILQPNAKLVYKITCKAVKEGSAKNTAVLRYDQFNKPIMAEEGTSVYK